MGCTRAPVIDWELPLKVARPQHINQDNKQLEGFKKTLLTTSNCWVYTTVKSAPVERPIGYFDQWSQSFWTSYHTIIARLITACDLKPVGSCYWLFKAFWLYGAVEPLTGASLAIFSGWYSVLSTVFRSVLSENIILPVQLPYCPELQQFSIEWDKVRGIATTVNC